KLDPSKIKYLRSRVHCAFRQRCPTWAWDAEEICKKITLEEKGKPKHEGDWHIDPATVKNWRKGTRPSQYNPVEDLFFADRPSYDVWKADFRSAYLKLKKPGAPRKGTFVQIHNDTDAIDQVRPSASGDGIAGSSPDESISVLTAYLQTASALWDRVDTIGDWGPSGGRWKLSEIYVPVLLRPSFTRSLLPGAEEPANTNIEARSENQAGASIGEDTHTRLGAHMLVSNRIAIFGRAGIGKSCFLRSISLAYAARWLGDTNRWEELSAPHELLDIPLLPVFLDLRRLQSPKAGDTWDALIREASRHLSPELGDTALTLPEAILSHIRSHGDTLLLIDGLDEITDQAMARLIVDMIDQSQRAYPRIQVMMASRWSQGRLVRGSFRALEVELSDLSIAQRDRMVSVLYAHAGVAQPDERAREFAEQISRTPILLQATRLPLFLELLAADLDLSGRALDFHDDSLARALLNVLIERRAATSGLRDISGWERPAGHIALRALQSTGAAVDGPFLSFELDRAFDFLGQSVEIGRQSNSDAYRRAMIDSGLLRNRPLPPDYYHEAQYDFVIDEIRDWLGVSAMFGNWSPDSGGQSPDADEAIHALLGSIEARIPFARWDQLRLMLLEMPEPAARRFLDRATSEPDNLAFIFQVMQHGRAPGGQQAWEAVRRCCALVAPGDTPETSEEIFARLREDFGGPELSPKPWGTILGLYGDRLPGASRSLHSAIDQRDWLQEPTLVDDIRSRIAGADPLAACAAMFEVLNWAFATQPYVLQAAERRTLEGVVRIMLPLLECADSRADFAAWTLNWLCMASVGISPWIDPDVVDREALARMMGEKRRTALAHRSAAVMLSKIARLTVADPHLHWLDNARRQKFFGANPVKKRIYSGRDEDVNAILSALRNTNDWYSRGILALSALELGVDHIYCTDVAIDFALNRSERAIQDRIVAALGTNDKPKMVRQLSKLLSSENERLRIQAVMALLGEADRTTVQQLRASGESSQWQADILWIIDDALRK
ncbi:NACHT domain-containing protein, partial [Sphingobium sp. MK2]|uniref:NACHT domain-containing protein n=1 Tax=Sphingobium sp. MK2 TaxID=3116540 RepID=UPI0032E35ED9